MSLTDDIYRELLDGLEKVLDWPKFLAKYNNSKGPLYNAIGRFFTEIGPKVEVLKEEMIRLQRELEQSRLTLDSLAQKKKETEIDIASLEDERKDLDEQAVTLETKLAEKSKSLKHLAELERLGFNIERLNLLRDALREIGLKHGLKGKEAVDKFFVDLKGYGVVFEAEMRLKGLQIKTETTKLEAENWQAKEETLRRKHDDLKEAIEAVCALREKGIKVSQIVTWHQILTQFQTVEQFGQFLAKYSALTRLLNARKEEAESYETRLVKAQSQVEALEKQEVKLEAAIDALKVAGVKELRAISAEAVKQILNLAGNVKNEIHTVGQKAIGEFEGISNQFDTLTQKAFELGQRVERTAQELWKYEGIRDVLESLAATSEEQGEVPEKS